MELVAQQRPVPKEFRPGTLRGVADLPPGRLKQRIEGLPVQARERAVGWLRSFHFTEEDLQSLRVDNTGAVFYADEFHMEAEPELASAEPVTMGASVPVSPFPASLVFHSRPGAPNVLYLDFDGETVTGTAWNSSIERTSIPAVTFSTDGDYANYSDSEQLAIRRIWQRVAEDFAPFDINVTTERPPTFNNRTAHALITRSTDANGEQNPAFESGGVAYVNVFGESNYSTYRPAWVYSDNLAGGNDAYVSEAASHEIGHNLGLSHDGVSGGAEYYSGHGSGDTGWKPIMGSAFIKSVTQWSKGEYYNANNTQDDLATMAGKISYRADDHDNTIGSPTPLLVSEAGSVQSTTPQTDPSNNSPENKGVIESKDDADAFSFVTGTGPVALTISPWVVPSSTIKGGNVDLVVELYDQNGVLVASDNGSSVTYAQINTSLAEGLYYVLIRSTGVGNPLSSTPSGYTSYGSIGQYFISGSVTPTDLIIPPSAELSVSDVTGAGVGTTHLTVTYSDNVGIAVNTIGTGDLVVTGPNGYSATANFLSVDQTSNGTPRVATYGIDPPGSHWAIADNGIYTVSVVDGEVMDVEGASAPAGVLGSFSVSVPSLVYSANMDSNPGWTLEPLWEYGLPLYLTGGPLQAHTGSNIIAYNLSGNYENRLSSIYATTPPIDCSGVSSPVLKFYRWLRLRSGDTAAIQASTDGALWVDVWSTSDAVSDNAWQEVQYPLPPEVEGSPTMRLRWVLASNPNQTDIGWNLDDVQVLGYEDNVPPTATLAVTDVSTGGSATHNCTVTYQDESGVLLSSLDSSDLLVTGPNGYSSLAQFVSANPNGDSTPLEGTYAIPAPGGTWDASDDGVYQVSLVGGEVEDTQNNAAPSAILGSFAVSLTLPGQLQVLPSGGLAASGTAGGPFAPGGIDYTLTNSGGMALSWSVAKTAAWLSISTSSGTLEGGQATVVTVSLNSAANNLSPGNYSDTVTFANTTTGNGDTSRAVSLTVNSHGLLAVTGASGLTATGTEGGPFSPASIDYTLTNNGETSLDWTASKTAAWVTLSSSSGSLAPGASTTVTLTLNATAETLASGDYTDTIAFANTTTGSGDTSRSVSLTVNSHGLLAVTGSSGLSASGTEGGPFTPASIDYTLTNNGETSLDWTASKTAAWVSLSSTSGTLAPNESATVTVSINTTAETLAPDDYSDTILFANTTTGEGNTSRAVSLTVNSHGSLAVTESSGLIATGTEGGPFSPASTTYVLTNSGGSSLNWTAGISAAWLSLSSTTGTLASGESTSVTLSINSAADALEPGTYGDTLSFTDQTAGSIIQRSISLTVNSVGILALVHPTEFESSGITGGPFTPDTHLYVLTNAGGTTLDWAGSTSAAWLTLSSSSGTLAPGQTTNITVLVNDAADSLNAANYFAGISFQDVTPSQGNPSAQSTISRTMILMVLEPGRLAVSSGSPFSASGHVGGPFSRAAETYTVSNIGETEIAWTASSSVDWLELTQEGGTLPPGATAEVTVQIAETATTLNAGTHTGTISFTEYGSGAAETFACEVQVFDLPALEPPVLAEGGLNLQFFGIPGGTYFLEASSDLETWAALETAIAAPDGQVQFTDAEAGNQPHRFYRAQAVQ